MSTDVNFNLDEQDVDPLTLFSTLNVVWTLPFACGNYSEFIKLTNHSEAGKFETFAADRVIIVAAEIAQ